MIIFCLHVVLTVVEKQYFQFVSSLKEAGGGERIACHTRILFGAVEKWTPCINLTVI